MNRMTLYSSKLFFTKIVVLLVLLSSCGEDGTDGPAGFNSLVVTTILDPGTDCIYGGVQIDTGLDNGNNEGIAANGILEEGEITETSQVCTPGSNQKNEYEFFLSSRDVGFASANISDQYPDSNVENGIGGFYKNRFPRISMEYYLNTVTDDTTHTIRSMFEFDLTGTGFEDHREFQIEEAILYSDVRYSPFNTEIVTGLEVGMEQIPFHVDLMGGQVSLLQPSSGNGFREANMDQVTWNKPSDVASWDVPGVNDDYYLDFANAAFIPNNGIGANSNGQATTWNSFSLDTLDIKLWQLTDKGFGLMAIDEPYVNANTDILRVSLRVYEVILYVRVSEKESFAGGRKDRGDLVKSARVTTLPWDEQTEAQRMQPLSNYLRDN